jgi:PAS domain S-box-containing protein
MITVVQKVLLLVEDDAIIAMSTKALLERHGCRVLKASSGQAAIDLVKSAVALDLILMDIDLGRGMDGIEAATLILKIRDIPLVFLSSHIEKEYTDRTEQISSYGYIVKHAGETVLLASIRMAFKLFAATTALRRSEERFRMIVERAPEPIFIQTDQRFAFLNPAALRLFGARSPGDLVGTSILDRVDPAFHEIGSQRIRVLNEERSAIREAVEQQWLRLDGSAIWVETVGEPYEYEGKAGALVFVRDRTEQKQHEELSRENERKYRTFVDHLPGIAYMFSSTRGALFWAEPVLPILGYSPTEIQSSPFLWIQSIHPEDAPRVQQAIADDATGAAYSVEYRVRTRDGRWVWLHDRFIHKMVHDDETVIHGFATDITGRRQAEEALRRSEAELCEAQQLARLGRWDLRHQDGSLRWSAMIYEIFEVAEGGFGASYEAFLAAIHPDDRESVDRAWQRSLDTQQPYEIEHRLRMADGRVKWVHEQGYTVFDADGHPVHSTGIVQDITARKAIECELADQKQYLESILDTSADGFWTIAPDRTFADVNDAYCRMSGYRREELLGMRINDIDALEGPRETLERIGRIMRLGSETFETRHRRKDGTLFDVEVSVSRLDRSDGPCLVCFCRDITERKRSAELLGNERRRLAAILEGTNAGTWEWNVQTGAAVFNERWAAIIGYRLEELAPVSIQTWQRFAHPDDLGESGLLLDRHLRGEFPFYEFEGRIKHKDGNWVWVLDRGRVVSRDETGAPLMMMGTHQDITRRKRREELQQRLADVTRKFNAYTHETIDYQEIIETVWQLSGSKYAVLNTFDSDGQSFSTVAIAGAGDAIHRAASILGVQLVGRKWGPDPLRSWRITGTQTTLFSSVGGLTGTILPSKAVRLVEQLFQLGHVALVRVSREERLLGDFTLIFGKGDRLANQEVVEQYADIVGLVLARVEAEERNAILAREKETLLNEVQHRIKNTMHTMVSLLSLQATTLQDPAAIAVVKDIQSRFSGFELLYDQLYRTDHQGSGSVRAYLDSLVQRLVGMFPNAHNVVTELHIDDIALEPKRLSALGLIVNELVTNAMKYAYGGNRTGTLSVQVRKRVGQISLAVADDGPGLPTAIQEMLKKQHGAAATDLSSFGIAIVLLLAQQLDGTIDFTNDGGTTVKIVFPA